MPKYALITYSGHLHTFLAPIAAVDLILEPLTMFLQYKILPNFHAK
jgi:hypothetical protein